MCSKTPIGATLKGKLRRKFIFYSIKAHIFDENRQVLREIYKMSEFHFRNSAFVVQWGFYFLFAKHIVLLHAFASAIYNYLSSWRIWLPLHLKPMLTFSRNYYRIYPPTMWFRKLSPRNVQNPDHLVSKTQTKRNYISPKRLKPGSQLVRRQSKYSSWIFQYDLQYLKYFLNYVCILIINRNNLLELQRQKQIMGKFWCQKKQRPWQRFRKMFKKFLFKILLPRANIVIENLRMMPRKVFYFLLYIIQKYKKETRWMNIICSFIIIEWKSIN